VAQASIEPVINSPYIAPAQHFVTVDGQVTGVKEPRRRPSEFFVPVAPPRKRGGQLTLDPFGPVRQQSNEVINEIRGSVDRWRTQRYPHTTLGHP
jgi:type III restriction enzyme